MRRSEAERIRNRIRDLIVVEIETNDSPSQFIVNLGNKLEELVLEEIVYGRKRFEES